MKWCSRSGVPALDPYQLTHPAGLRSQYPQTFGKVQAQNPGRWLSHDEAFGQLVGACQDETEPGLRDEVAVRLALSGMRATPIGRLTVAQVDLSVPKITWTGKGNKPSFITPGEALVAVLSDYFALYRERLGVADLDGDLPVLCLMDRRHGHRHKLCWGVPARDPRELVHRIITTRARKAGLGHVAPHDGRRTAAGILHNAKDGSGAHFFDLLDIQRVLDHADPVSTMRSYIDPMDTDVKDRAAIVLD